jgi:hypothetical protein
MGVRNENKLFLNALVTLLYISVGLYFSRHKFVVANAIILLEASYLWGAEIIFPFLRRNLYVLMKYVYMFSYAKYLCTIRLRKETLVLLDICV